MRRISLTRRQFAIVDDEDFECFNFPEQKAINL